MNTKKESPERMELIEDANLVKVVHGKDKITTSERHEYEPIHSRIAGVKSLGEILKSDFKYLFSKAQNHHE